MSEAVKKKAVRSAAPSDGAQLDTARSPAAAPLRWFAAIPVAMLLDSSISAEAVRLAAILLHYNGPSGCYPKVETLQRDLNAGKNTVLRLLEELERYGFLVREREGRNNRYHLRPVYERPVRPDSLEATGDLQVQNAPRPRPPKRNALHKPRPAPRLPLETAPEKVPPVEPIERARARRQRAGKVPPMEPIVTSAKTSAPEKVPPVEPIVVEQVPPVELESVPAVEPKSANRFHPWDLDKNKNQVIKNQQQQEPIAAAAKKRTRIADALVADGFGPEDAARWATDLRDLDAADVVAAARIMRQKPAYRRGEIIVPAAYIRALVTTQVQTDRELAEHERRKDPTALRIEQAREQLEDAVRQFEDLDDGQRALVEARARELVPVGETHPAWKAAIRLAMAHVLGSGAT